MNSKQNRPRAVTIAGPGRVGRALHAAAQEAGYEAHLIGREELAEGLPAVESASDGEHVVLLAVPDGEIENACRALCAGGPPPGPVGHLSGATPLTSLSAAAAAGVGRFSMHPLQTFSGRTVDLQEVPCAVTATEAETLATAEDLASSLGMKPFRLAEEDRAIYHAAASMASNFLVALEEDAAGLLDGTGIRGGRELLAPLVTQSVANWVEHGAGALTGPIARGDTVTVARHIEALSARAPELLEVYKALASRTERMADSAMPQREKEAVTR